MRLPFLCTFGALTLALSLACGGKSNCEKGEENCTEESAGGGGGGNSRPEILDFSANSARVTEGDRLVFTVMVTDPDGLDDVVGGSLESSGGASYGSFEATGNGSYELSLDWSELDTVQDVEFQDEEDRSFTARFYDSGGKEATAKATVTLYCDEGGACAGRCVDLRSDPDHCGVCGNSCAAFDAGNYSFSATCEAGSCLAPSDCVTDLEQNCTTVCAASGMTCASSQSVSGIVLRINGEGGPVDCDAWRGTTTTTRCSQDLIDAPDGQYHQAGICVCLDAP
ncbi:MAG TPA: hypothetical protein PLA94_21760 [Myxococcota bacterium]|nr:hypothetical protein [Myxococcota bacterium]